MNMNVYRALLGKEAFKASIATTLDVSRSAPVPLHRDSQDLTSLTIMRVGSYLVFQLQSGRYLARVSGRSVRFCTLSGAFLTSVEVPIERRAGDTQLLRHLTC